MLAYYNLVYTVYTILIKMSTISSKTLLVSWSNFKNSLLGDSRVQGSYFSPDIDLKFVKEFLLCLEALGACKSENLITNESTSTLIHRFF